MTLIKGENFYYIEEPSTSSVYHNINAIALYGFGWSLWDIIVGVNSSGALKKFTVGESNLSVDTSRSLWSNQYMLSYVTSLDSTTAVPHAITPTITATNNVSDSEFGISVTKTGYLAAYVFTSKTGLSVNIKYTDTSGNEQTQELTEYDGFYKASFPGADTSKEFVLYSDSPAPTTPTITNNIPNSSAEYSGSNHQYTLTVVADDGYIFNGDVEASYMGYSTASTISATLAVSTDKKTATGVCPDVDESTSIVLTGETTAEITIDVVNNIDYTSETHTYNGNTFTIDVTATTSKYRFKTAQIQYVDNTGNSQTKDLTLTMVDGVQHATGTADVKNGSTVTVVGSCVLVTFVSSDLSNCELTTNIPEYLFQGDTLTVTLNANDGTLFEGAPYFSWYKSGIIQDQYFTIDDEKKTAVGTFNAPTDYYATNLVIHGTATSQTPVGKNYGSINVYKVTLDNLEDFSQKRFFKESVSSDDTTYTYIDLGQYVNRVKRMFFNVPTYSTDVIKCGNYNTGIQCEAPDTDEITINFGSITIPTPNGDATDYLSELQMFVPFHGYTALSSEYVGKTMTLTYIINVITGSGVAKVLCGDDVVLLLNVEPNQDIIYKTNVDKVNVIGNDGWKDTYLYGIEPYVYVKYYNSLNKEERNTDCKTAKLGDLKGYCVVDNVTLNTTPEMTADEQETIISTLKSGVYINE